MKFPTRCPLRLFPALSVAWACLALVFLPPAAAVRSAEVVYNNTTNVFAQLYRFSREHGDEVELAGSSRVVTEFVFQYFADFTNRPDARFRVRFYANDGPDAMPGPQTALAPGSLLWESDPQELRKGAHAPILPVPGIQVPDRFTWTVEFTGVTGASGDSAGLILADPPTVGRRLGDGRVGSYYDAWIRANSQPGAPWTLINFGFGLTDPKANFYARISAEEDPRRLRILTQELLDDRVFLTFPTQIGRRVRVQVYRFDAVLPTESGWVDVEGEFIPVDDTTTAWLEGVDATGFRLFRLVAEDTNEVQIVAREFLSGRYRLRFTAARGQRYQVEESGDLRSWGPAGGAVTYPAPDLGQWFEPERETSGARYYRVRRLP